LRLDCEFSEAIGYYVRHLNLRVIDAQCIITVYPDPR
jgi:hypothetical protein